MVRPPSLRSMVCLVASLATAVACKSPEDEQTLADGRIVAVVVPGAGTPSPQTRIGIEDAADEAGFSLSTVEVESAEELMEVVARYATEPATGLLTPPLEPEPAFTEALRTARERGLPVIVVGDFRVWSAALSTVGADPRHGGRAAAGHLAELLDGTGRVVAAAEQPGSRQVEARLRGARAELAAHSDIEIVVEPSSIGPRPGDRRRVTGALVSSDADAILALDRGATEASLAVLRERTGWTPRLVGVSSTDDLREAVVRRRMDGLVRDYPAFTGERAVEVLAEHLAGDDVPARVDTGVHMTTQGDEDWVAVPPTQMPEFKGR